MFSKGVRRILQPLKPNVNDERSELEKVRLRMATVEMERKNGHQMHLGVHRRKYVSLSTPPGFLRVTHRTLRQVLLLCGPPGLGKTTLAYVLARQAGYQVLEVNASDDRTANIVTERIRNALESTSLSMMGKKNGMSKPTCVIIDEIDGSGGGGDTVGSICHATSTVPITDPLR